ncbi:MAG: YegS/Rv2252/BmrU family lipid kinase [Clostridiaceae bacterium]
MKRVKFMYNPGSGDGRIKNQLDTVIRLYQKYGFIIDAVRLDESVRDENLFTEPQDYYDHILVAGGDGTCDVVLNELKRNNLDTPIGILPRGTANDYAHYIGMTGGVEESVRQILTLPPQSMDIGLANDRYFLNVFSCGYFTDISQKTRKDLKNAMGVQAYFLKSLEMIRDFRQVRVKLTSKEFQYDDNMFILTAFNGVSIGNLKVAHKSRGNDGLFDVIMLNGQNLAEFTPAVIKLIRGDESALKDPGVVWFQTDELTIETDESVPSDVDGEKGPDFPVKLRCIKDGVRILGVKNSL